MICLALAFHILHMHLLVSRAMSPHLVIAMDGGPA